MDKKKEALLNAICEWLYDHEQAMEDCIAYCEGIEGMSEKEIYHIISAGEDKYEDEDIDEG